MRNQKKVCLKDRPPLGWHLDGTVLLRLLVLVSLCLSSFSIITPTKAAFSGRDPADPRQASPLAAPLPLPDNFFGEILLTPAPAVGAPIQAWVPGASAAIATTQVELSGAILTYAFDVPGDNSDTPAKDGASAGDWVTFSLDGVDVARALWVTGSHTRLDITNSSLPPSLPNNFYGEIHFSPTQPAAGTVIEASIAGLGVVAATLVVQNGAILIYALDVPADNPNTPIKDGASAGDQITFSVGGIDSAAAPWHSGAHTRMDLTHSIDPPPLPASFYGEIRFSPTPPAPGTAITASIPGLSGPAASTTVVLAADGITLIYSLSVPGDFPGTLGKEGGAEGDLITFSVGGVAVATAPWHAGSHTRLDFGSTTAAFLLQPGWNLASFNLQPANTAIAQVLGSISGRYSLVYTWNASVASNIWQLYDPAIPVELNSLTALDEKRGFWIFITSSTPVTLTITGNIPTSTTMTLDTTAGGWNLVGYPAVLARTLPGALPGQVSLVYAYHPVDVPVWKLFDPLMPIELVSLTSLTPGWGYWVKTSVTTPWVVPYP